MDKVFMVAWILALLLVGFLLLAQRGRQIRHDEEEQLDKAIMSFGASVVAASVKSRCGTHPEDLWTNLPLADRTTRAMVVQYYLEREKTLSLTEARDVVVKNAKEDNVQLISLFVSTVFQIVTYLQRHLNQEQFKAAWGFLVREEFEKFREYWKLTQR